MSVYEDLLRAKRALEEAPKRPTEYAPVHPRARRVTTCCGKPEPDALHDHCLRCHRDVPQSEWDCPWCGPAQPKGRPLKAEAPDV